MFRTLTRRFTEWSRLSRDISLLKSFDDHLLADLGIERKCIRHSLVTGKK